MAVVMFWCLQSTQARTCSATRGWTVWAGERPKLDEVHVTANVYREERRVGRRRLGVQYRSRPIADYRAPNGEGRSATFAETA
jgi:hypothetical protein